VSSATKSASGRDTEAHSTRRGNPVISAGRASTALVQVTACCSYPALSISSRPWIRAAPGGRITLSGSGSGPPPATILTTGPETATGFRDVAGSKS
jgi:hypothetical protein